MGGASYPAGVTAISGETLALSTALASLGIPGIETKQAILYNPNYDFRLHINPAIIAILFYDASNSAGARYEVAGATSTLSRDLTDRSAIGSGTALDSATSSDRLYICCSNIVGGLYVDMTSSVNSAAAALTANYWTGSAWSSLSAADGTASGGASLAQDGSITWTAPSNWMAAHLGGNVFDGSVMGMNITDVDAPGSYGFWVQLLWNATLSSDVEIANIWTLNRNTNRGYFHGGQEYTISFDRRHTGAIEAILAALTDTMEITWIKTIV